MEADPERKYLSQSLSLKTYKMELSKITSKKASSFSQMQCHASFTSLMPLIAVKAWNLIWIWGSSEKSNSCSRCSDHIWKARLHLRHCSLTWERNLFNLKLSVESSCYMIINLQNQFPKVLWDKNLKRPLPIKTRTISTFINKKRRLER